MSMQITNMRFDPVSGAPHPFPANAQHYRMYNPQSAVWLFNPWTGTTRDARDVAHDKYGVLIVPNGEPGIQSAPFPKSHNTRRGTNNSHA